MPFLVYEPSSSLSRWDTYDAPSNIYERHPQQARRSSAIDLQRLELPVKREIEYQSPSPETWHYEIKTGYGEVESGVCFPLPHTLDGGYLNLKEAALTNKLLPYVATETCLRSRAEQQSIFSFSICLVFGRHRSGVSID